MASSSSCVNYDCAALLAHVLQEEAKVGPPSSGDMMDFGHAPAPNLFMFQLSAAEGSDDSAVLMVAYTRRCISAQVLSKGEASEQRQDPFLVTHLMPEPRLVSSPQKQQQEAAPLEESISSLTMVALDDLSLVTLAETNSQVIFDDSPKKKRVQFDGPTQIAESSAKIRNLQLRGVVEEHQAPFPRSAIVFGTNKSRVLSVELRWDPATHSIVLPLEEVLEPLPLDPPHLIPKIQDVHQVPFCPLGGANQIAAFVMATTKQHDNPASATPKTLSPTAYIWISYGDGTILRIHHSAFFRSVVGLGASIDGDYAAENEEQNSTTKQAEPSLHERLQRKQIPLLLRSQTKFSKKDIDSFCIIPLPKYHPSPLAPLPLFQPNLEKEDTPGRLLSDPEEEDKDEDEDDENESTSGSKEVCEALLFAKSTATVAQDFPTFCFYTSEDQFVGRVEASEVISSGFSEAPIIGAVMGGTKAVMGGLVGALSWGFGGGPKSAPAAPTTPQNVKGNSAIPQGCFPNLRKEPIVKLFAGHELHDAPRQVESCIIDPEGDLAATTDNFGRVLLIDLSTKQIIRMWKGFREASTYWLQVPRTAMTDQQQGKKLLYLVIHSRQRRVVEVYRVRHGPRVKHMQVERDAQVVSCKEFSQETGDYISSCYVVHSNTPGSTTPQVLEKIVVEIDDALAARDESQKASPQNTQISNPKEAALRLQRLQQLLANTNVPCQLQDVHQALLQVKSLKDLATCLDRLAVASVLETKMGVTGTEFQKTALSYCRESLKDAVKNSKGDPASNPHVKLLATKIVYHTQVINAFDILRRFEQSGISDEGQQVAPRSPWTEEAMGWLSTHDMVNGKRLDDTDSKNAKPKADPLNFSTFANACVAPKMEESANAQGNRKIEVYLSDSSKTRRDVLVHIFKPFLGDIYAFGSVNSIFGALGILDDSNYLLKCFGEWYMTLTTKEASQKGFYALYSPMSRWLQDMAKDQLEKRTADDHEIALGALHTFCAESEDLVKGFMLGVLCREAVAKTAVTKEEQTYGKISSTVKVKKWDQLLRKLRVCLLVSLRLKGVRIGTFPITVNYVEQGDIFSVYEWLAHDELAMSHTHREITMLEEACKVSGIAFDPSTEAGDASNRFEMLQNACLSATLSEEERSEYLVDIDDDDKLGALLLFLKSHNEPRLLIAHRALILSSMWSQRPHDLQILADTLVALQALSTREDLESLAAAVRLEIWQTRIRPIYRALLFGFHDVQEVSENVLMPLFHQIHWIGEFSRLALEILTLLLQIPWKESMNTFEPHLEAVSDDETWPPVRKDFILERLVNKSRQIDRSALDMHRAVICALRVSNDIQVLVKCVPNFHECFEMTSLFDPVPAPSTAATEPRQMFLEDAIIANAQNRSSADALESFGLGDIETLGAIWKFDMKNIRTTFLLAMYEFGKDKMIDALLVRSSSLIEVSRLVEKGTDIVCRRLNDLLHTKRRQAPAIREVMGVLDADLCSYVRDRAERSRSLVVFSNLEVPIDLTRIFTLRLLSLSRSEHVDKDIRAKIHGLNVLTGHLVKAIGSGDSTIPTPQVAP